MVVCYLLFYKVSSEVKGRESLKGQGVRCPDIATMIEI